MESSSESDSGIEYTTLDAAAVVTGATCKTVAE
jgi:hypothetical protein